MSRRSTTTDPGNPQQTFGRSGNSWLTSQKDQERRSQGNLERLPGRGPDKKQTMKAVVEKLKELMKTDPSVIEYCVWSGLPRSILSLKLHGPLSTFVIGERRISVQPCSARDLCIQRGFCTGRD
jgi:hypothetical protein